MLGRQSRARALVETLDVRSPALQTERVMPPSIRILTRDAAGIGRDSPLPDDDTIATA
jgi:hypothetical protein